MTSNERSENQEGDGREFITIHAVTPITADNHPELADQLLESRTQLGSQTGYMMRFGEVVTRHLNVYDVLSLPGTSYPVSTAALDSLPAYVRAKLEQDGAVQVVAQYDPNDGYFSDASLNWEERSAIDRIAELIGMGYSLHEATDYVVTEEDGTYTVSQWATIRKVETEAAIEKNVRAIRRHTDNAEIENGLF